MKKILLIILSISINTFVTAQTIIDYQSWNPSNPPCNLFGVPTNVPVQINGNPTTLTHLTNIGQPIYNTVNKSVDLNCQFRSATGFKGTQYQISSTFRVGYSYSIKINAAVINGSNVGINASVVFNLNNGGNGGNNLCQGMQIINPNTSGNLIKSATLTSGVTFADYTVNYTSLPSNLLFLTIGAVCPSGQDNDQYISIRKITITETAPAASFTLTPSSLTLQRGNSTTQTFTVNNTPGVTGYTWNLGATPNGWLLNGNPAPSVTNTTTNTLQLSSVSCANAIANVSASATIGTTNFQTNTCFVSLSEPIFSITGTNIQCSASTQTYTLNTNTCNNTVIWSVDNSLVTIVPNGSSVDVSTNSLSSGSFNLTANIAGINGSIIISKQINVGPPSPIINIQTAYTTFKCNVIKYIFTVVGAENATNYKWYYRNITQGSGFILFKNSSSNFANSPVNDGSCDQIEILVEASNQCSQSAGTVQSYTFVSDLCPPYYDQSCGSRLSKQVTVKPNPVNDQTQIELIDTFEKEFKTNTTNSIKSVRVFDKSGNLIKTYNGNGNKKIQLNLSSLKYGIYTILVYDGQKWFSKQIVKE